MNMTHKLLLIFLVTASAVTPAEFDAEVLPEKLAAEVQKFFGAETGRARSQMAAFSDEDLQKITTAFKRSHPASEQRLFWLIEESYRRNAERVAAERIRFLYIAVLLALGIIAAFAGLTYIQTRKLRPANAAPQAITEPEHPVMAKRVKGTAKKGKRK